MADRLVMEGIGKAFGGTPVLRGVDFRVGPGEVVALLGANGAGKSTLMKVLTGVHRKDAGTIAVEGRPAAIGSPREAARLGIALLPQELSVMPDMSVAENVCLPSLARDGRLARDGLMRERARAVLAEMGFGHLDPARPVASLAVAERRVVEIARALASRASLLVMDEPTAALPERDSRTILDLLRRLARGGVSVVFISHYLSEVFAVADRIEVLRDGRNAGSFRPGEATVEAVLEAMLGRAAGRLYPETAPPAVQAPVVLSVEDLSGAGLSGIDLTLRAGEVLGVFGLVGSGIERLGRLLFGAEGRPASGRVTLAGRPYIPRSPARAKAAGLGLVTAERKADGLLPDMSVSQNLAAAFWSELRRGPLASRRREEAHAAHWIARLGIRAASPAQPIRLLSGGNQQKVLVARWLRPAVRVLILEEPTRGVDMGARADIYAELAPLAADGLALLVLGTDAEEVAGLADRSLVLARGRIVRRFDGRSTAADLLAATVDPPRSAA